MNPWIRFDNGGVVVCPKHGTYIGAGMCDKCKTEVYIKKPETDLPRADKDRTTIEIALKLIFTRLEEAKSHALIDHLTTALAELQKAKVLENDHNHK